MQFFCAIKINCLLKFREPSCPSNSCVLLQARRHTLVHLTCLKIILARFAVSKNHAEVVTCNLVRTMCVCV